MDNQEMNNGKILELHEDDINQEFSSKKNIKKIIIIVLIIFVVLAVALLAFFVFRKTVHPIDEKQIKVGEEGFGLEDELIASDLPEHDMDRDGILDEQEAEYGTSDLQFDTDWDGIPDKIEIEQWGTDPTNSDTDGDGFSDGFEIMKGFNPNGEGSL